MLTEVWVINNGYGVDERNTVALPVPPAYPDALRRLIGSVPLFLPPGLERRYSLFANSDPGVPRHPTQFGRMMPEETRRLRLREPGYGGIQTDTFFRDPRGEPAQRSAGSVDESLVAGGTYAPTEMGPPASERAGSPTLGAGRRFGMERSTTSAVGPHEPVGGSTTLPSALGRSQATTSTQGPTHRQGAGPDTYGAGPVD
jgi:hypothetical protein